MASTVLDRALARKAQLTEELEEVEQFIALYHRFESPDGGETADRTPAAQDLMDLAVENAVTAKPRQVIPIVLRILHDLHSPLSTRHIFDLLTKRGVHISGKNPLNNLSAMLSYDKRVRSTPDGWVVAEGSDVQENKASQPLVRTREALTEDLP